MRTPNNTCLKTRDLSFCSEITSPLCYFPPNHSICSQSAVVSFDANHYNAHAVRIMYYRSRIQELHLKKKKRLLVQVQCNFNIQANVSLIISNSYNHCKYLNMTKVRPIPPTTPKQRTTDQDLTTDKDGVQLSLDPKPTKLSTDKG